MYPWHFSDQHFPLGCDTWGQQRRIFPPRGTGGICPGWATATVRTGAGRAERGFKPAGEAGVCQGERIQGRVPQAQSQAGRTRPDLRGHPVLSVCLFCGAGMVLSPAKGPFPSLSVAPVCRLCFHVILEVVLCHSPARPALVPTSPAVFLASCP